MFLDFCEENKLSILNTWYDHPIKHRITWHSPDAITKKVIDYSISESWLRQYIKDVRVRNSYFNSDHRLLVSKMRTPANKAARFHKRKPKRKSRYNLKALNTQEIKDELCDKIIQVMHAEGNDSVGNINKHHEKLISTLTKARDTLPQIPKNRTPHPWDDEPELKNLIAQRDKVSKGNSGHQKCKII